MIAPINETTDSV